MKILRSIPLFFITLFTLTGFVHADTNQESENYTFTLPANQNSWQSELIQTNEPFDFMGLTTQGSEEHQDHTGFEAHDEGFELEVKIKKEGIEMWYSLELEDENGQGPEGMLSTEPMQTLQLRYRGEALEEEIQITTHLLPVDDTQDQVDHYLDPNRLVAGLEMGGNDVLPAIVPRSVWGADESLRYVDRGSSDSSSTNPCQEVMENYPQDFEISYNPDYDDPEDEPYWAPQYSADVNHLVVHHTTTGPTTGSYAKKVQDIYRYHTVSRGWGDIGYNYLIDPNGIIYEGRHGGEHNGLPVVGGHALCSNANTIGIALIENHQENPVSPATLEALTDLLAYFSDKNDLDPTAQSLWHGEMQNVIGGHKDFQATACPGKYMYDLLPHVREVTQSKLQNYSVDFDPANLPYNAEALQKEQSLTLDPYEKQLVTLEFKNTGTHAWGRETWLYAVVNDPQIAQPLLADQPYVLANMDQAEVKPGGTATFQVQLKAGFDAQNSVLYAVVAADNKAKISRAPATVNVQVNEPILSYKVTEENLPSGEVKSGEVMRDDTGKLYSIKIENTGNVTWPKSEMVLAASGPKGRSSLFTGDVVMAGLVQDQVKPGQVGEFTFTSLKAPSVKPGENIEQFIPALQAEDGTLNWLPDQALGFRVNILGGNGSLASANLLDALPQRQNVEDLFRVKLGYEPDFDERVSVSSDQPFYLQNLKGGRYLELPAGASVSFEHWRGNILSFRTSKNQKGLVSGLRITASPNTPLEIDSWNNPPAWNENLNDNEFLGTLEFRVDKKEDFLLTVNELSLEKYLLGLAEVSDNAHPEKQKVMAVIARTYASFYQDSENRKFPGQPYDGSSSADEFQKYIGYGYQKRSPNFSQAVQATADQVVTYNRALVKTPYFTQTDGTKTRSAEEVWGWTHTPYLKSVDDSLYETDSFKGHGVGLSGRGATAMAEAGKSYLEIIQHYYTGVEVEKI